MKCPMKVRVIIFKTILLKFIGHAVDHHDRINVMHVRNKIAISKVPHAGHGFTANNTCQHRASANDTKALG